MTFKFFLLLQLCYLLIQIYTNIWNPVAQNSEDGKTHFIDRCCLGYSSIVI